MNKFTPERRQSVIFFLSSITAALALIIVFVTVAFEAYIRWTINKDFTVFGGFELEALTFSVFALLIGLLYLSRREN